MKNRGVLNIIKSKNIVIPTYILEYYKELNISEKELIFLCYLLTYGESIPLDIELFHNETKFSVEDILELISNLSDKKLIETNIVRNDKGISEEFLKIAMFNNKILSLTLDKPNVDESKNTEIYSQIEKEFGRVLSPIEYETIKRWLDSGIKETIVKEALKEAVLNGVFNIKYIDRILYEWGKNGYKRIDKNKSKEEEIELFDYNWLDEDE
ncbi:MAG TPA: DnaD domain protein [Bacilli bacterium]|nr:DnaD domain protein [Bacilli bacterium]